MSNRKTDTYSAAEVAMRNSGLWVRLEDHNFVVAQYIRKEAESDAARLRGEAAPEGQAVAYQTRIPTGEWSEASWETYERVSHNRPADARELYARPQPAAPAPVAGWLQAVDTELMNAHLGVANADDDFEAARRKLSELIQWHIDVSHDPRVNGAPVAGDAGLRERIERIRFDLKNVDVGVGEEGSNAERERIARLLFDALAQDRESQAGAPDGGVLTALQECRDKRQATPTPAAEGEVRDVG